MLSAKRLCALLSLLVIPACMAMDGPLLSETTFTGVDIETTGLSPQKDRIVEISCVRFTGTNVLWEKTWLINPGTPIPGEATRVHGLTDGMVRSSPAFETIAEELTQALSNTVVIAHNAAFDWNFIQAEYSRAKKKAPSLQVIDSLAMAKKCFPDQRSYALGRLIEDLGLDATPNHRAEADTLATVKLVQKCLEILRNRSSDDVLKEFAIRP